MASSRGYGQRGSNRLADMSLPAELRRKPKRTGKRIGGTPAAQMDHASSARARKKAREGEQKMAAQARKVTQA